MLWRAEAREASKVESLAEVGVGAKAEAGAEARVAMRVLAQVAGRGGAGVLTRIANRAQDTSLGVHHGLLRPARVATVRLNIRVGLNKMYITWHRRNVGRRAPLLFLLNIKILLFPDAQLLGERSPTFFYKCDILDSFKSFY